MHWFRSRFTKVLLTSISATALLLVAPGGRAVASDDDEEEKSTPKSAVQKEQAADKALFEKLDENEDGWLSGTEMSSVKSYDLDGNGRVTLIEFLAGQAKARLAKKPKASTDPPVAPPIAPPDVEPSTPLPPGASPVKSQPAPATQDNFLIPLVGRMSLSQTQLMNRYLSLLTASLEKGSLTARETEQKVLEVAESMPGLADQVNAAKTAVSPADRAALLSILDTYQLLRTQARMLVEYSRGKDEKLLAALHEADAAVRTRLQKLMGDHQPQVNDTEQTVNTMAAEGNKLAEQAGQKMKAVFSEEQFAAFPGNRETFKKSARGVAELLGAASAKFRAAAKVCEKASEKSDNPSESRYWTLLARSLRRTAESKEAYRSLTLLIEDESVQDRKTFEKRAETLDAEATEVNEEAKKLALQALELWKKIHPEK